MFPVQVWKDINICLVGFGQIRCKASDPQCKGCPVSDDCPSKIKWWFRCLYSISYVWKKSFCLSCFCRYSVSGTVRVPREADGDLRVRRTRIFSNRLLRCCFLVLQINQFTPGSSTNSLFTFQESSDWSSGTSNTSETTRNDYWVLVRFLGNSPCSWANWFS